MDSYLQGTDVTLRVPLVDTAGNPLSVSAIDYRVTDENEVEIVARTALATFAANAGEAAVPVPAASNTLATGMVRGLRSVELYCTIGGNQVVLMASYVIETADPLVVGVNSFQSYTQAEFTALGLANIDAWERADRATRLAALIDARAHIVQLSFAPLNSNVNWGQDSLNYIPEGRYDSNYVGLSDLFLFSGNLELLRPEQFVKLPTRFLDALKKAQIAEADAILGNAGSVEAARNAGLVQDVVGESRQMFRSSKPLQLPCSRRALSYLSYFVSFAKRVGRA